MELLVHDRYPVDEGPELWAVDDEGEPDKLPVLEGWGVTYRDEPNFAGRILVPGAFRDGIKKRPLKRKPLTMGYEHSSFTGTQPIGAWHDLKDDPDQGVFLTDGRVSATTLGRDVSTLIRDGAINGLSVGFIAHEAKIGLPGEEHTFKTPYGKRSYAVAEDGAEVVFVTRATLLETSVVSGPADDEARLTKVQSITSQAARALPGLEQEASWDDLRYSMALLMGGRGAGHDFRDLPLLERVAMYQRLCEGYARERKAVPPFEAEPEFHAVPFANGEREVFTERYSLKRLAEAAAGIRGLSGPLSRDGCAMALAASRDLVEHVRQTGLPDGSRDGVRELRDALTALLESANQSTLADELGEVLALVRSEDVGASRRDA